MKTVLSILAVSAMLASSASAQLFGTITDAPQHIVGGGGGCDGNQQCSGDVFFAEKIPGTVANYSINYVELVPSWLTTYQQLGSSANATTTTPIRTLSVKPIVSTGDEQVLGQIGRVSLAVGMVGGFALPSGSQPSTNLAIGEHFSVVTRLNKTLNTVSGGGNWYIATTAYFTQILGIPNGQTWAARLNILHSGNGTQN